MTFVIRSLLFTMMFGFASFAKAEDDAKTLKTLKEAEKLAYDFVGNGSVYISKYNPATFDMGRELALLKKQFNDMGGRCKFNFVVGRKENLEKIGSQYVDPDSGAADKLKELHSRNKIKTIISAQWDGEGDGVSCSIYYFEIFTVGGNRLTLDYQLTD